MRGLPYYSSCPSFREGPFTAVAPLACDEGVHCVGGAERVLRGVLVSGE